MEERIRDEHQLDTCTDSNCLDIITTHHLLYLQMHHCSFPYNSRLLVWILTMPSFWCSSPHLIHQTTLLWSRKLS